MNNDVSFANVSFYEIDDDNVRSKYLTACRLAAQAYRIAQSVYILTSNDEITKLIDEMLWGFSSSRFVPHVVGVKAPPYANLIRIGSQLASDSHYLLINLTERPVGMAGKIERIFEIVLPSERESAQARRAHYQQLNCAITTHAIPAAPPT